MQTKSIKLYQQDNWQQVLANAITDPTALIQRLQLPLEMLPSMIAADQDFALRVPEPYLQRIKLADPNDPLLLQILPAAEELIQKKGFVKDPLAEKESNQHQGLIHKYQGRVLLIISGGCAINCRYCFRRHFPYGENQLGSEHWQKLLGYLRNNPSITEVIFSGGDPLATSDQRLAGMVADLESIPHLKRLRIHTRLPVVIPQRVTRGLLEIIETSRLQTVIVTHINHPNEIDEALRSALAQLKTSANHLLNQSVLLKGINDCSDTLKQLSESLFDAGVIPYYLHLLDPVEGASHFDVSESSAKKLVGQMCDQLPGYMVPKLVKELAGASAKVPIAPVLENSG